MNFGYKQLYIGGRLADARTAARRGVICPATEEPVAEVAWAGKADAEEALRCAERALVSWSRFSIDERADWMRKLRSALMENEESLRLAVMWETGKPWDETAEDFQIIDALQYFPEEMRRRRAEAISDSADSFRHRIVEQPAGVVVAYLPWNFPLLCLGFKLGPALAAGCTIVVKPSPYSPLSACLVGEVCAKIGFPAGVINILCGSVEDVAQTLSGSTVPRVVTMIGSSAAARGMLAQSATSIKRYSLELGGNAPVLVFEDADLELAVSQSAALKFGNCGQICVAPNRFLIQRGVYDRFAGLMLAKAQVVRLGFGRHEKGIMGPLIGTEARDRVDGCVRTAIGEGAELLCGGMPPPDRPRGFFYQPTVLGNVAASMQIFRDEIFGPVATLVRFDDETDALRLANDTPYGLASYVYTQDASRAERLGEALEFGEVMINGYKWSVSLPHMGIKESGVGADCSGYALEPYLVRKRITVACKMAESGAPEKSVEPDAPAGAGFRENFRAEPGTIA